VTILLTLTGLLVGVSGVLKARAGLRIGLGVDVFTITEILFALVLAMATAGAATLGTAASFGWMIPTSVVLVLVSTTVFGFKMRAYRLHREELEARRLESYVKYFHKIDKGDETPEAGS